MSQVSAEHHATSPERVRCVVVTVSDTRTLANDIGGQTIVELLQADGHEVLAREIIPDDPQRMTSLLRDFTQRPETDAVLLTGGTGVSSRDQTFETVSGLLTRQLPGYGELLRMLSYQQIGPAAMLTRAVGGLIGHAVVLTMPGSPAAVRLAMESIILPELGHLVREARR